MCGYHEYCWATIEAPQQSFALASVSSQRETRRSITDLDCSLPLKEQFRRDVETVAQSPDVILV